MESKEEVKSLEVLELALGLEKLLQEQPGQRGGRAC